MILKNCVLSNELAKHAGYNKDRYRRICKDNYFTFENRAYIPKTSLKTQKDLINYEKCTKLDDYLPLAYFARHLLNVSPQAIRYRIKFAKETNIKIFDYIHRYGQYYIKVPKDLQAKFSLGLTLCVTDWKYFKDYEDVDDAYLFADWLIIFLK